MKQHYTYLHFRADTAAVFYVGKGSGRRAWSRKGRSNYWNNIVKKHGRTVSICAVWDSEERAFEHEVEIISSLRLAGAKLVNLTTGGEGVRGYKKTPSQLLARSLLMRQFFQTERGRKVAESSSRRVRAHMEKNPGRLEAMRAAVVSHFSNPENRSVVSRRMLDYYADAINRERLAIRMRAMASDPARQAAHSRSKGGRPLRHVESGLVYQTQGQAARALGLRQSSISQVLSGRNSTASSHTFSYLEAEVP